MTRDDEASEHVLRADSLRAHMNQQADELDELEERLHSLRAKVDALAEEESGHLSSRPADDPGYDQCLGRAAVYGIVLDLIDEATQ